MIKEMILYWDRNNIIITSKGARDMRKRRTNKIKLSTILYIIGAVCIVISLALIIPDITISGFTDIFVNMLFMFIVNMKAFAILLIGLSCIIAGIILSGNNK